MTYSTRHFLVTAHGYFGNPAVDIWQVGFRFAPGGVHTDLEWDAAFALISADDIRDAWGTFHIASGAARSNGCYFGGVKVSVINQDGHLYNSPKVSDLATPPAGYNSVVHPPQCADVVTLRTGATFGKAKSGRIYLPGPGVTLPPADQQVSSGPRGNILTAVKTALHSIEGEVTTIPVPVQLAVMSSLGSGTTRVVTQLEYGSVVDTQRRRRNQIPEARSTLTY